MSNDIVVITYRDSDSDNDTRVFAHGVGTVTVIDVDNGCSDLSDRDDFISWGAHHLHEANKLRAAGEYQAAEYLEKLIREEFDAHWGDPQDGLPFAEVVDYISEWERIEGR